MAWSHLDFDRTHLAYMIIGGFTSLFMLVSLFVKERLYIGEATVATLCGVIFGPHAANLFNPFTWGNTDKITLELSRIVLVVQCFAIGVELPKSYMERHWKSVFMLLVPNMTFGWLITSLFVFGLIPNLSWLESLAVAACVTATDPVLASSVVGKGKFAKRVPRHLRDVLSAESGCNDGMAFPFIYLSVYLIQYNLNAGEVTLNWICITILYECLLGSIFGFCIGYAGRYAIKWADRYQLIDRESFLALYLVIALFCAGAGSSLGFDDLLIGFSAGIGFSNDGWFTKKTEETHVSNVIDLLLNLSYFVYLGSVIPWDQFNAPELGITPWRLVIIAILVLFFRRIPSILLLKPFTPDIKNWREAAFAGHFGPIGVGAVFAAILARAELENESTEPEAVLPGPGSPNYLLIQVIWPIVSFLVITSILVHGSSIAVFTLGKHINTLTLTMSYTQGGDNNWMNRLPRIASTSRSMSKSRFDYESGDDEKFAIDNMPRNFLRRQKEDDNPSRTHSRASSRAPRRGRLEGMGGPISASAIAPQRRRDSSADLKRERDVEKRQESSEDTSPDGERKDDDEPDIEAYIEGENLIVEDEEGEVLHSENIKGKDPEAVKQEVLSDREKLRKETDGRHAKHKGVPHEHDEGSDVENALEHTASNVWEDFKFVSRFKKPWQRKPREPKKGKTAKEDMPPERTKSVDSPAKTGGPIRSGHSHAYQYGNTIIVEDEDGEVIKKYDLPQGARPKRSNTANTLTRVSTWIGLGNSKEPDVEAAVPEEKADDENEEPQGDDDKPFVSGARKMTQDEFIKQLQALDPKARIRAVEDSNASGHVKEKVKDGARRQAERHQSEFEMIQQDAKARPSNRRSQGTSRMSGKRTDTEPDSSSGDKTLYGANDDESPPANQARLETTSGQNDEVQLTLVDSNGTRVPLRTSEALSNNPPPKKKTTRSPPPRSGRVNSDASEGTEKTDAYDNDEQEETAAERRRRLAALGEISDDNDESESESDGEGGRRRVKGVPEPSMNSPDEDSPSSSGQSRPQTSGRMGIRFAENVSRAKPR